MCNCKKTSVVSKPTSFSFAVCFRTGSWSQKMGTYVTGFQSKSTYLNHFGSSDHSCANKAAVDFAQSFVWFTMPDKIPPI